MINRLPRSAQSLVARVPKMAVFGARMYVTLVVAQFLFGFIAGAVLTAFDYDLLTAVQGATGWLD